jgi:hypothetical protein
MAGVAEGRAGQADVSEEVLARLEAALRRAGKRAESIRREMAEGSAREGLRETANLLLAHLGKVQRGAQSVTLMGFHGEAVEIPLEPSLSPQENVQAMYREAARSERAGRRLPTLLEEAEKQVLELDLLRTGLLEGTISPSEAESRLPETVREGKAPDWTPGGEAPLPSVQELRRAGDQGGSRRFRQRRPHLPPLRAGGDLAPCQRRGGCSRHPPLDGRGEPSGQGFGRSGSPGGPAFPGTPCRASPRGLDPEKIRAEAPEGTSRARPSRPGPDPVRRAGSRASPEARRAWVGSR